VTPSPKLHEHVSTRFPLFWSPSGFVHHAHKVECCKLSIQIQLAEFGHAAGAVPIGNVDVSFRIDVASVGRAKEPATDIAGLKLIICPLRTLRIVTEKSNGRVVAVENCDAAFEFGNDCVI